VSFSVLVGVWYNLLVSGWCYWAMMIPTGVRRVRRLERCSVCLSADSYSSTTSLPLRLCCSLTMLQHEWITSVVWGLISVDSLMWMRFVSTRLSKALFKMLSKNNSRLYSVSLANHHVLLGCTYIFRAAFPLFSSQLLSRLRDPISPSLTSCLENIPCASSTCNTIHWLRLPQAHVCACPKDHRPIFTLSLASLAWLTTTIQLILRQQRQSTSK
jgi:hypothetical protein